MVDESLEVISGIPTPTFPNLSDTRQRGVFPQGRFVDFGSKENESQADLPPTPRDQPKQDNQVFMKKPYDDPFSALDTALKAAPLGGMADAVVVDAIATAIGAPVSLGAAAAAAAATRT